MSGEKIGADTPFLEGVRNSFVSREWYRFLIRILDKIDGTNMIDGEIPVGAIDGVNRNFTLSKIPTSGSVHVYLNGLRQRPDVDFTIATNVITFAGTAVPSIGDNIYADYRA